MKIDLRPVQNPATKLWGYKNNNGELVIDYQYDNAGVFDLSGYAHVRVGSEQFYIDTNGNEYSYKDTFHFPKAKYERKDDFVEDLVDNLDSDID